MCNILKSNYLVNFFRPEVCLNNIKSRKCSTKNHQLRSLQRIKLT